jgi:hypothetical protein
MTLVELLIASSLSIMVVGALMSLMLVTARQQRLGLVEQRAFAQADQMQDRIAFLLRGASRDAGIFLGDPSGAFFRRIVFREKSGAVNQEIRFAAGQLIHDPNLAASGDEVVLGGGDTAALTTLLDVRFQTGMKAGGIPDSALILVTVEVSDEGRARRSYRDGTDPANQIDVTRSFAVNLRRI